MSDFAKTWDNMNLRERIAHLLADWQQSKNTNDPMVLRIAATMAHHQLEEADADIVALTAERDEAMAQVHRCKTIIDGYIQEVAKQKIAIMQGMRMINNLNDVVRNMQRGRPT